MEINMLAVLVLAVAHFVLGMAWYSKGLFGSAWMKMIGMTDKDMEKAMKQGMAGKMFSAIVSSLVMMYALAYFVMLAGASDFMMGSMIGLKLWLGFLATSMLGIVLWENKPVKLYLLNAGYYLVSFVIMSGVFAIWQ